MDFLSNIYELPLCSDFRKLLLMFPSSLLFRMDEGRQPLSRKLPISSSRINPYRMIVFLRLAVLGLFFHYRIRHPVPDAYGLWLTSIICEIWFAVSWIFDQFPKFFPIERETYLDRLSLRYMFSLSSLFVPPACLFLFSEVVLEKTLSQV